MKKLLRWPTLIVLAAFALAALVPAVTILHAGKSSAAHAAGNNPTISMPDIVHPFDTVTITGQGFYPGDIVSITIDNPYNYPLVSLSCDSSGNCSGVATIPSTNVAQGTHQVNRYGQQRTVGTTARDIPAWNLNLCSLWPKLNQWGTRDCHPTRGRSIYS